jgi:hypothetical protein
MEQEEPKAGLLSNGNGVNTFSLVASHRGVSTSHATNVSKDRLPKAPGVPETGSINLRGFPSMARQKSDFYFTFGAAYGSQRHPLSNC